MPNASFFSKSGIGASAVQLTVTPTVIGYGCLIKADSTNSGIVRVSNSASVTLNTVDATDGWELPAGAGVFLDAADIPNGDVANIYVIGSASGQRVCVKAR